MDTSTDAVQAANRKLRNNGDGTYSEQVYIGGQSPTVGAASVGGGASTYSNTRGDFTAAINNGTKTITLSSFLDAAVGAALTAANFASGAVVKLTAAGVKSTIPLTSIAYNAGTGVLTLADAPANFVTGELVEVTFVGPDKTFKGIAGEDLTNNVLKTRRSLGYTNISASALIKTGAGVISGGIVNSHSSGTLKLWDNTSAATTVLVNTITFAAGSGIPIQLPGDIEFSTGLYATIGGTADITLFWK